MVLTADHGSVVGRQFYGTYDPAPNYGFNNWYYGNVEQPADTFLTAQDALKPLVATENLGYSYSDSMVRAWLTDQSPAKVDEAAAIMAEMPAVSAVWRRNGDDFDRVSPIRGTG